MKRYRLFGMVCGLTLLTFLMNAQAQEKYPSHQIELVVPMAAGGNTDVLARIYSENLTKVLKVPVVVVNRAAAAPVSGVTYVALAKKDGYTLLGCNAGAMSIVPSINPGAKYSLKDFAPLGSLGYTSSIYCVNSNSHIKTFKDLVEYAQRNPGKLKRGGFPGSETEINLDILCAKSNIEITNVPYKGGGESVVALLGGHIDLIGASAQSVIPHIKAGKLRGLVITSAERDPDLPDVPIAAEFGFPHDSMVNTRACIFAPAGVPQSILDVLIPAVEKAFKDPEVLARAKQAKFIADYKVPEEVQKVIELEIQTVKKYIKYQPEKK